MKLTKQPETLTEIRNSLCSLYSEVMSDPKKAPQVHEASSALGKAISTCKTYLVYCGLAKEKPSGEWARFISTQGE